LIGIAMKKGRNIQPLLVALVLVVLTAALWILHTVWQAHRTESVRQQEAAAIKAKADALERKVAELEAASKADAGAVARDKADAVFGPPAAETTPEDAAAAIQRLERQVSAFFEYLDTRDYIKRYGLEGGMARQYADAMEALSARRPQVAGETEALAATVHNVYHFFRVLGRTRVELATEVLRNEPDMLEPAMRTFHRWHNAPGGSLKGRAEPPVLVDYAAYLLSTLGGRSYMLRRTSKIRLLTTYYCLMVIDGANDKGLNRHGLDIRPFIPLLTDDMRSQPGLMYRQSYLSELERLARKYLE